MDLTLQRWASNGFILLFLGLIAIDGLPSTCPFHRNLKKTISPVVGFLGIRQGSWNLFAPGVDKENVRLEATLVFEDGSQTLWHSPRWVDMGPVEKFLTFRKAEYFDNIRLDRHQGGWDPLANYLVKQHASMGKVRSIHLTRCWTEIAAPGHLPIPEDHTHFFEKDLQ